MTLQRNSPLAHAALDLIDEDELVALTQELVRAPGQNPPGEEAATVAVLESACRERDFTVTTTTVVDGRDNVRARTPSQGGPGLLLLGHTDVVPLGDGWTVDPVGGLLRDGRIYGRGTTDMKGGLAASVIAMSAVQRAAATAGIELTGPIELSATVDEEATGIGIRHLVQTGDHDTYVGCITAEPTDLQTIIAARGDAYVEIIVHGLAAHAGRPSDGKNAIYGAAAIIRSLQQWHDELTSSAHPLVGPPTWNVGAVTGGETASIVPAVCKIQADRRLLPGEDPTAVLAQIRERIARLDLERDGLRVEVEMPMDMPGFETAPDHPFVVATDAALSAAGGPGLELGGWTAACDGGFIARDLGVPVVVLGPGSVNNQAHRADESVGVDELIVAAKAYALTAVALLT